MVLIDMNIIDQQSLITKCHNSMGMSTGRLRIRIIHINGSSGQQVSSLRERCEDFLQENWCFMLDQVFRFKGFERM